MEQKIIDLYNQLKEQIRLADHDSENNGIYDYGSFSNWYHGAFYELAIIERYVKNPNERDYDFITEYILVKYQ